MGIEKRIRGKERQLWKGHREHILLEEFKLAIASGWKVP